MNKMELVTGASSGIGAMTARSLWTGMPVTAYKRSGNSCTNSSKSADVE